MADKDPEENDEPIIRDKRRIDPETGKVRQPPADAAASSPSTSGGEASAPEEGYEGPDVETSFTEADLDFLSGQASAEELAAERLADLQRLSAEYANYRKRTEANREVEKERAIGDVIQVILPVLDDLDLAEKHGDLAPETPFGTIAAKLRVNVERLGLTAVGVVGEAFDPTIHEAVFQQPSADVEVETVLDVVQTGYFLGSTLLRAAKVVVAVPNG